MTPAHEALTAAWDQWLFWLRKSHTAPLPAMRALSVRRAEEAFTDVSILVEVVIIENHRRTP